MSRQLNGAIDVAYVDGVVERLERARTEIGRIVLGQDDVVDQVVLVLMGNGHALIEGSPGLGKTLLAKTTGEVFGLDMKRIQFTPDLMPADITGTNILTRDTSGQTRMRFENGPVFTQLLLADEINRATPKTQSALLEAMQERTVTVSGVERALPRPFMVMATQNPIEMEGTYALPEAQLDRFFLKIKVELPSEAILDEVLHGTTGTDVREPTPQFDANEVSKVHELVRAVPVAEDILRRVARFVVATHPDRSRHSEIRTHVRFGISPRGAQAWLLAAKGHALLRGRFATDVQDLEAALVPALRHRMQLNFDAQHEGMAVDDVLRVVFRREVAQRQ